MSTKIDFDIEGTDALIEQLRALGRKGTAAANAALREAAEPIAQQAAVNAERLFLRRSGTGFAAIKVGRIVTRRGQKRVLIGIDRGDISEAYYMKFHEFGTAHEPPRPFLIPAYHQERATAYAILRGKLKEAVKP